MKKANKVIDNLLTFITIYAMTNNPNELNKHLNDVQNDLIEYDFIKDALKFLRDNKSEMALSTSNWIEKLNKIKK